MPPRDLTLDVLGRAYGVDVIDYGEHRTGDGLLVHNGTGIALAVMDAVPDLRYVVDLSGLRAPIPATLRWFMDAAGQATCKVAAALIFFGDHPDPCRDVLHHIDAAPHRDGWRLVVLSNVDLGHGLAVDTFERLVAELA